MTPRESHDQPMALLAFADWLEIFERSEAALDIRGFVRERHAGIAAVELHRATELLTLGMTAELLTRLSPFRPEDLPAAEARHLLHLRGRALFAEKRLAEARVCLSQGSAIDDDRCNLAPWVELVGLLLGEKGDPDSAVSQLISAVSAGDQCLVAGDIVGAQAALDVAALWLVNETQSMARLAEAYLAETAEGPQRTRRKTFVLSAFAAMHGEPSSIRSGELPLADMAWSAGRLDDVARRANEWLERHGG